MYTKNIHPIRKKRNTTSEKQNSPKPKAEVTASANTSSETKLICKNENRAASCYLFFVCAYVFVFIRRHMGITCSIVTFCRKFATRLQNARATQAIKFERIILRRPHAQNNGHITGQWEECSPTLSSTSSSKYHCRNCRKWETNERALRMRSHRHESGCAVSTT